MKSLPLQQTSHVLAATSCSFWIMSRWCRYLHCCPPRMDGTFLLFLVQANTLVGRNEDCMLISSFYLQVFQNLDKVYAQFVGLMLAFISQLWMDFAMGTKISSIYTDFCLNSAPWTMLRMHYPVLTVFIHFVAPLVSHMRINVLTLVTWRTQNLRYIDLGYGSIFWPNAI